MRKLNREIKTEYGSISSAATFRKLLQVLGAYRFLLIGSILLAAISVVLQLYVPILFGRAIDGIIDTGNVDFALIGQYLRQILLLVVISGIATWIMNMINNRMTYRVVRDIRSKAIRSIQTLPLSYLDQHSSGDIVSRVIADVDQLSDGLLLGFTQLFTGAMTILMTLVFMFSQSVSITLFVVVLTPVSFFVARFIAKRSYHMFQKQATVRGQETALIEEMIGNAKVVKAFHYEDKASARFQEINQELGQCSRSAVFYSSLTNPSTRFVNSLIYAGVTLLGAYTILAGGLTVGGLSALLNYANQYMKPFNDISSVVTELQNAFACAARIFALIEEKPEKDAVELTEVASSKENTTTKTPEVQTSETVKTNTQGTIDIQQVHFRYVEDQPLIQDFHLHAEPGTRIAIVGPTGCGKTTMINLLMRFYDVNQGDILIDGESIYAMSRHVLRQKFGMVLQDTWLMNGTVRENIAIGSPDATEEEIIHAAKEAHSWEFIKRLPKGLDTVLTDDSLSQGQKQLLCITRVMLALPPMLILDEATSSIDTRTELLIQGAFDKLMEGRTSFIVAHRLSTIRNADIILVMKDGQVIEQGNHEELMKAGGFYEKLYNAQFAKTE